MICLINAGTLCVDMERNVRYVSCANVESY
jgi:hypothetical protein